jgi:antitoxin (DNA-binding transcriptional repressor) of toxin-antitoxin stability system
MNRSGEPSEDGAIILNMATIHISAADAVRDFDSILARIQAGETFVIERESLPVAVVAAPDPSPRLLSEVIEAFKRTEAGMDAVPVLDPEFAEVVEERIRNRKPRDLSQWA